MQFRIFLYSPHRGIGHFDSYLKSYTKILNDLDFNTIQITDKVDKRKQPFTIKIFLEAINLFIQVFKNTRVGNYSIFKKVLKIKSYLTTNSDNKYLNLYYLQKEIEKEYTESKNILFYLYMDNLHEISYGEYYFLRLLSYFYKTKHTSLIGLIFHPANYFKTDPIKKLRTNLSLKMFQKIFTMKFLNLHSSKISQDYNFCELPDLINIDVNNTFEDKDFESRDQKPRILMAGNISSHRGLNPFIKLLRSDKEELFDYVIVGKFPADLKILVKDLISRNKVYVLDTFFEDETILNYYISRSDLIWIVRDEYNNDSSGTMLKAIELGKTIVLNEEVEKETNLSMHNLKYLDFKLEPNELMNGYKAIQKSELMIYQDAKVKNQILHSEELFKKIIKREFEKFI